MKHSIDAIKPFVSTLLDKLDEELDERKGGGGALSKELRIRFIQNNIYSKIKCDVLTTRNELFVPDVELDSFAGDVVLKRFEELFGESADDPYLTEGGYSHAKCWVKTIGDLHELLPRY